MADYAFDDDGTSLRVILIGAGGRESATWVDESTASGRIIVAVFRLMIDRVFALERAAERAGGIGGVTDESKLADALAAAHEARLRLRLPRDAQTDALCAAVGVVAGIFRVTDAYLTAAADDER